MLGGSRIEHPLRSRPGLCFGRLPGHRSWDSVCRSQQPWRTQVAYAGCDSSSIKTEGRLLSVSR